MLPTGDKFETEHQKFQLNVFTGRQQYQSIVLKAVKVKAVPLQAYSGPEGPRKLRFPDFMTTAQDGGKVVRW